MRDSFTELFIDGSFSSPEDGDLMESVDPSTGKPWGDVALAGERDVDRAVGAANDAFAQWRAVAPSERGRLVADLADRIEAAADELAQIDSRDNGKPISQSLGDARSAVTWLRYYGGAADKVEGSHFRLTDDEWVLTIGEPLGVVGSIIPWNYPLMAASLKMGAALVTGNTLVLKPSELAASSTLALAELVSATDIPAGVVNVIPGLGNVAGQALVRHPDVAKISFTGSERTAQEVGAEALRAFKGLTIEAGGKAPFIVFDDSDVGRAVDAAVSGMFVNAGQQCTVASRVFVQRSKYDEFVDRYVSKAKGLRVGDPRDPNTEMGAIVSEVQRDRILHYLQLAKDESAVAVTGGGRLELSDNRLAGGYWIEPTVLVEVDPKGKVCQEEIFGPVVCIMPFDDEAEAIRLANDIPYGLVSAVWTKDLGRAQRVSRQINAGVVWVNTYRRLHPSIPYGGAKRSGFGRENGMDALRDYTETKSIIIDGRA